MFENWFGGKKVEGVTHFDGKQDLENQEKIDALEIEQDEKIDSDSVVLSREKDNKPVNARSMFNVSNERRKEGINDRRSNWKEKEPFALDLSEESEDLNEKHLNAMAETYDDGDDFEEDEFENDNRRAA